MFIFLLAVDNENRKFYVLSYSISDLENFDYEYILKECRSVYQEEFK